MVGVSTGLLGVDDGRKKRLKKMTVTIRDSCSWI
jgi:hypothetical protein